MFNCYQVSTASKPTFYGLKLKFITSVSYNSGEPLKNLFNPFSKRSFTVIAFYFSAYFSSYPSFNLNCFSPFSLSSLSSLSVLFFLPPSSPSPFSPSVGVISTIGGDICWSSFCCIALLSNLYRRQVVIEKAVPSSGRPEG